MLDFHLMVDQNNILVLVENCSLKKNYERGEVFLKLFYSVTCNFDRLSRIG